MNEQIKFTPGPWEWRDGFLCQVNGPRLGFTYDYNAGNRPLIAAAPDMLEALKAFVEAYEKSLQLEKTDVALRMARIAIEKAEQPQ